MNRAPRLEHASLLGKALSGALLVAFALGASLGQAAEIRTIGEKLDDDIVSIGTEGGRSVIKTARGKTVALSEVKHIRFDDRAPSVASDANVILLDQDELRGTIGAWDSDAQSFKLRTSSLGEITVKIDAVAGILFVQSEAERRVRTKYLGWLEKPGFEGRPGPDAVYIKAGGKATGTLDAIASPKLKLDAEGIGKQEFALNQVEAVVCGNAGAGPQAATDVKGTLVRIRCADGSSVSGTVKKFDGGRLELENVLGTLTIASKDMLELFVLNGAFVYLSDLKPEKVEERFPDGFFREKDYYSWKPDKEVCDGGRLRLGGRSYDKGLGVHTYCALTYRIGGAYKEFRAVIGLDDVVKYWGTPGNGNVTFRVLVGDEKKGMKPARELPEGRHKKLGDPPEELTVNVEGVDLITLVADYGNYMHVLGRADWADAHLVKR
jgi:hypothetical protein